MRRIIRDAAHDGGGDDDELLADENIRISGGEERENTGSKFEPSLAVLVGETLLSGESCLTTGIRCRRYFVVATPLHTS